MRTVSWISIVALAWTGHVELAAAQQAQSPKESAAQSKQTTTAARGDEQKKAQDSPAQEKPAPTQVKARTPPSRVDVDELAANPEQYIGKSVRVQGEIEEFVGPRAFTLDEDSFTATEDVLVVLPRATVVLRDDADVIVQGAVHRLTRAQLERDYGWLAADPEWVVRFDQRPIILASVLQSQKGTDLLVGAKANAGKAEEAKAKPVTAKPGEVARSPDKFYGRQVAVQGEIEDVFGTYVFTLDEDALFAGPDVLVITQKPAAAVVDGAEVRVSGTVRPFTWAEIRRDYDFLRLDSDLVVRFENRPVILADSVARVANANE